MQLCTGQHLFALWLFWACVVKPRKRTERGHCLAILIITATLCLAILFTLYCLYVHKKRTKAAAAARECTALVVYVHEH